jgi:hypothetical protein
MAKSPKKPKVREDLNQLAARIVAEATGAKPKTPDPDAGKSPRAIARGRKGGVQGGPARAARLSPAERSKIARQAAKTRWTNAADQPTKS